MARTIKIQQTANGSVKAIKDGLIEKVLLQSATLQATLNGGQQSIKITDTAGGVFEFAISNLYSTQIDGQAAVLVDDTTTSNQLIERLNLFFLAPSGGSGGGSNISIGSAPPLDTDLLWFNTVDSLLYRFFDQNDTFGNPINNWLSVQEFKTRYANTGNISGTVFLFPYGNSATGFLDTYALTDDPVRITRGYMNAKFNSVGSPVTFTITEILPAPVSQTYVFNYQQKVTQELSFGFFPKISNDNIRITFAPNTSAINVNLDVYYRKEYVAT